MALAIKFLKVLYAYKLWVKQIIKRSEGFRISVEILKSFPMTLYNF